MAKRAFTKNKKSTTNLTAIIIVGIIALLSGGLYAINKFSPPSISDFPTLMDAAGSVDIEIGDFKLDKQPFIGDVDAPVTVVEFLDYKCPSCKSWVTESYPQFKAEFVDTGKVKLYTINFPFLGPDSILAALAGESIAAQNPEALYEFTEKMYQNQGEERTVWATEKYLLDFVKNNVSGIDYDQFKKDMKKRTYLFNVKEDFKISAKNRVEGTPYFYVNDQAFYGNDYQAVAGLINAELSK